MRTTPNLARILVGVALAATACNSQAADLNPQQDDTQQVRTVQSQSASNAPATVDADGVARSHRTQYTRLSPAAEVDFESSPLCRMVRHPGYEGYGLYKVTSLVGYVEQIDGNQVSATYAEFVRVDDFYRGQAKIVVRMDGGPMSDGDTAPWDTDLSIGETVAVLGFVKPWQANLGFYGLDPTHMLKQRADGGYTNGQMFARRVVDGAELHRLVAGLAGHSLAEPCPYEGSVDKDNVEVPPVLPPEPGMQVDPDVTKVDDDAP